MTQRDDVTSPDLSSLSNLIRPADLGALPNVAAAFTTRDGGVSQPPFGSLNLGFSTGDSPEDVEENRRRVARALGFTLDQMAIAGQVHGDTIRYVEAGGTYPRCDGLITDRRGVLLCMMAADCASVLLADAHAGIVGACHSGWRGTVARISAQTVGAMIERGADPARVRAYVSPCIGIERFEVGEEVAAEFAPEFVDRTTYAKPHVDLKAAIRAQLIDVGVPDAQIQIDAHCTHTHADRFFSYRLENGETGRMMGVIGLR